MTGIGKGQLELPAVIGTPTARNKFQALKSDLDESKTTDKTELAAIEHAKAVLNHFRLILDRLKSPGKELVPWYKREHERRPKTITEADGISRADQHGPW